MYRLLVKTAFFLSAFLFVFSLGVFFFYPGSYCFVGMFLGASLWTTTFFILVPPTIHDACIRDAEEVLSVDQSDVWLYAKEENLFLPWYNAISKEIGPSRLIGEISGGNPPRLLVIPANINLTEKELQLLSMWLEGGCSILCELPGKGLAALGGLRGDASTYACTTHDLCGKTVTLIGAEAQRYLAVEKDETDEESSLLYWQKQKGKGYFFAVTFGYSTWALSVLQGKPNRPGRRFRKKPDWNIQGMQTPDMRAEGLPPVAFEPQLDRVDQALFATLRDQLKIPAWWYYPRAQKGAFALTFDEDWFGKRCGEVEKKNIPATWFVVDDSDFNRPVADQFCDQGDSIGFHWNRFRVHMNIFGWHFCTRKAKEQVSKISQKLKLRPLVCRIHYLRWDNNFDHLFYVMKSAGIQVDSSLGPGRGQHGYLFGTGFPYQIADRENKPIGIEEIPFQIHEPMGGATIEDHLRLVDDSLTKYHTTVVALFHPYYCLPGTRSYEAYTALLEKAGHTALWLTTLDDVNRHWRLRRQRKIQSVFKESCLSIKTSLEDNETATLRLPDADNICEIMLDGEVVSPQEKLILNSGYHSVEVSYT